MRKFGAKMGKNSGKEGSTGELKQKANTWATTVRTTTMVADWPEKAQELKKHDWMHYLFLVGDVLLVLMPIYFMLLCAAVIVLDGNPTKGNNFGRKVEKAIELGPTIFPIVFAAVSGRSMKMIARFLAEKGAKLGTLELLMASQSVWGTVESQLLMRRLTLVGANLLFLWGLSPLGGQASLRLMSKVDEGSQRSIKLRYMSTGPAATMWGLSTVYSGNGQIGHARASYSSTLLAPIMSKTGPRDPWGNVKIPNLETFGTVTPDAEGWITVTNTSRPETFSSLVGIPVVGLPQSGQSNFTLESTYISVSCGNFSQFPYPGQGNTTNVGDGFNGTQLEALAPGKIWTDKNFSVPEANPFKPNGRRTSFFLDTDDRSWAQDGPAGQTAIGRFDGFVGFVNRSRLSEEEARKSRELLFVSTYATSPDLSEGFGLNIIRCSVSQKHVEATVQCNGTECATRRIRKSRTDTRPSTLTGFEHGVIMLQFAKEFPIAAEISYGSSPTEFFLFNSSAFPFLQQAGESTHTDRYVNLALIRPDVFSQRLSVAINTYYQLTMQPTGYFGDLDSNLTAYGPDTLPAVDLDVYLPANLSASKNTWEDWWSTFSTTTHDMKQPFIGATTNATVTDTEQVYSCNKVWVVILLVTSGILFFIGSAALVLKWRTLAPDMFGFVSSMTYENPWVNMQEGGSRLDAMERARLLKDMEVYIGDVRGHEDVGHVALASGVPLRKLERGRLYV